MTNTRKTFEIASLPKTEYDYIGEEAAQLKNISDAGILIPQTYLITTNAFDEFIQANGFVDFILDRLAEIEVNPKLIRKNSKEIQKRLLSGQLSSGLKQEITDVYKKMSGLSKVAVEIQPSFLNKTLSSSYKGNPEFKSVYGLENIFESVKQIWVNMFSEESLLYREEARYEGPLTLAVLIKKDPMVEVSVLVDAVSPTSEQNQIEMEAIAGNISPLFEGKLVGDRYVYSLKEKEIKEKSITEQKWMEVYRFTKDKFKREKVDISKVWKSRPKLSDNQIQKVGLIIKQLKSLFENTSTVVLGIEMGRIIVLNITQLEKAKSSNFGDSIQIVSNLDILRQKLEEEKTREPAEDQDNTEAFAEAVEEAAMTKLGVKEEKIDEAKSINDYVEEVGEEIEVIKEEKEPEEVQEIEPVNKIPTVVDVFALSFNSLNYKKYSRNIDGVLALTGDKFVLDSGKKYQDLIKSKTKTVEVIVKYIMEVADKAEVPVIYTLASEIYREDLNSPFGASRISGGQSLAEIELEAIRIVRNKNNMKNVWLAIPFIRDVNEFLEVKKLVFLSKLRRSPSFKIFAVIDNSSSALLIEDLDEAGLDGLIYDLDVLSKHTLGYFVPGKTPVSGIVRLLETSMKIAGDRKIKSIVSGTSIEESYDIKTLMNLGFTTIAVSIEKIESIKSKIQEIEKSKLK